MPDLVTEQAGTLYLVHVLTHATRSRLDVALAGLGLTSFHYTVLSVIGHNEGLSSSRLSRRFYVTPQAMGELILLLEKRGFLVRSESPANRKVLHLRLTPLGRETLKLADPLVATIEASVFEGRSAAELRQFRQILSEALRSVRSD